MQICLQQETIELFIKLKTIITTSRAGGYDFYIKLV